MQNVLEIKNRDEFRTWLQKNASNKKECWLVLKRGKPKDDGLFYYLDAVEEALCFGWIDSTQKIVDGVRLQRFSPRKQNGLWSELNKERVRRLEKLGLMTDAGRKVLPDMTFNPDEDVVNELKSAGVWEELQSFNPLYVRVRLYNVAFYKRLGRKEHEKALAHLVEMTTQGKMYGEWNDYGRLLDY